MSSRKIRLNTAAVDLGCSCRRSSRLLTAIFHRSKKQTTTTTHNNNNNPSSKSLNNGGGGGADYYYSYSDEDIKETRAVHLGFRGDVVAEEKDSDDPYLDFRRSMMSMIVEKEIYSKDDLRELLNCFLQLNSPYHHGIIIRAFSEIWNGVYYSAAAAADRNVVSPTIGGGGGWGNYY
ncbi:transcription repressor OFP13-like [Impatiens glandulifera]|uniref:transcription repressor OFP13-like n=1 Tax=Impatiens glandulifera TaxID=253017 RepID=UPI001FB17997|nr:transcription repressor OFP13-like [Impatiens glandulifera]